MYVNNPRLNSLAVCQKCCGGYATHSLVNSAVDATLPAFAAERRRPPLSIDMSCQRGAQQQTRRTSQRLSNDGTDRGTDSRRLKQSVPLVGSRIKSGRELQAIGPATENARRPLSVELWLFAVSTDGMSPLPGGG